MQVTHIACSKLARPMICAGYMFLDLPETDMSHLAEEGIAAGEYLERLLTDKPLALTSSKGIHFDDDMKFYTGQIYEDIKSRANSPIMCEHAIHWETASGIWIKGKPDAAFVDNLGRLCIEDLKYGFGLVEVEENWQLLAYAIGEVIRRGQAFNEISLKIHQPRAHHEDGPSREWLISYPELLQYKEKIEVRMQQLVDGRRDLMTSTNCKHCMGAAEACPAFNRLFHRALEVSTEFFQDEISDQELATQLDQVKRADEVLKIKKDSLIELGNIRIKQGKIIPGYAQVKSYGNRSWKPGVSPESIAVMTGKQVLEKKFMTPAKAEKLGIPRELVNSLSAKKFTGVSLKKTDATKMANKIFGTNNPNGGN